MAELKTYGDLKKVIKAISSKQTKEKIVSQGKQVAVDQLLGLIPGASNAKTVFDFVKTMVKKPDEKKTKTWLDRLDVDDEMTQIVDDTVENGFITTVAKAIESEPDEKELESDFNMNAKMVNYLKSKYDGRFVTGIKESKMKKYNFETLTPDEKEKLKEYIASVKEIKKEIKKLVEKASGKGVSESGGNMSTGLSISTND